LNLFKVTCDKLLQQDYLLLSSLYLSAFLSLSNDEKPLGLITRANKNISLSVFSIFNQL